MSNWFRLHTEFASDPSVQRLSFADQRHYVIILCAKKMGILDDQPNLHTMGAKLRALLGLDAGQLKQLKRRLTRVNLINADWQPRTWNKRQYLKEGEKPEQEETQEKPAETAPENGEEAQQTTINIDSAPFSDPSRSLLGPFPVLSFSDKPLQNNSLENGVYPSPSLLGPFPDLSRPLPVLGPSQVTENKEEKLACSLLLQSTDTDTEKNINGHIPSLSGEEKQPAPNAVRAKDVVAVLKHLNDVSGSGFRWKNPRGQPTAHANAVHALLKDGYTAEQCMLVITHKASQWADDDKMREYLRPATLFRRSKFEQYLDQAE